VKSASTRARPPSAATLLVTATAALTPPATAVMNGTGKRLVRCRSHRSLTYHQHALLDQCSRDRHPGAGEDAGEGRPGNAHPLGGSFLVEPFEIGQPQSLELVQS
jgi:hypothetical protein